MWPKIYKWSIRISKFAAQFSFVAAALYAVIQWEMSKIDSRVKETLALYDKYNSEPFTTYRQALGILVAKNRDALVAAATAGDGKTYSRILLAAMAKNESANGLDLLADLFDGIWQCVSSRLCDDDVVFKLFQPRAAELYTEFFPYIDYTRTQNGVTSYAMGMQNIRNMTPKKSSIGGYIKDILF